MRRITGDYAIYLTATVLRAGLFYFIARVTSPHEFILYNTYVYYSDIFATLVGAGTLAALSVRGTSTTILSTGLIFEGAGVLILLALYSVKALIFGHNAEVGLSYLFPLTFLRTLNAFFCRYYLVYFSIARSTINDLVGNFLWIPAVFVLSFFFRPTVSFYLATWIAILLVNVTSSFLFLRGSFHLRGMKDGLKSFARIYANSFHFTLINKVYGTLEKIVMVNRFTETSIASSYLMASKVTGLAAELSGGFATQVSMNRIKKIQDGASRSSNLKRLLMLNVALMVVLSLGIVLCSDLIYQVLKSQISLRYSSLIVWLVPLSGLVQLHGVFTVFLQNQSRWTYLLCTSLFQIGVLGMLYTTNLSIYSFVGCQIAAYALLLLSDFVAQRRGDAA